ncbi:hypothetical protein CVT23_11840 [Minwuia thermotolerans]|uniref:Uncharacterized protein n=1 Tax=Minwuia thermotolerans TaxID=2056226 RepID=A0A2M9G225_9PROT|nr:hypothetical protein CVT23_11840 [Minwuia thermotolerans]
MLVGDDFLQDRLAVLVTQDDVEIAIEIAEIRFRFAPARLLGAAPGPGRTVRFRIALARIRVTALALTGPVRLV